MRITVSGPPGSGTTSLAKAIAEKYGIRLVSAGDVFRQNAAERNMDLLAFSKLCESDPSVDRKIDEDQRKIGEENSNIIIEGRLAGHMVRNADLRIWVLASSDCRAHRISDRENISYEVAKHDTDIREKSECDRYKKYYHIDIHDLSIYDLVISSEKWGKEELASVVDYAIGKINP
jgi:cytidylate kinase